MNNKHGVLLHNFWESHEDGPCLDSGFWASTSHDEGPGFYPRPAHVTFVEDKVSIIYVFLRVPHFSSNSIIQLTSRLFIYYQCCIIPTTDSALKQRAPKYFLFRMELIEYLPTL